MKTQPEALRLADLLEMGSIWQDQERAAAELRRLHAENEALLNALKLAWPIIEAEKYKQDCSYGKNFVQTKADRARSVYDKARAALRVALAQEQAEPVSGIIESEIKGDSHQTLDDAMQRPRAMAQAYENGYKAGVANEREACAKVCESRFMGDLTREDMEARRCAAAIRARGEMP